MYTMQGIFLPLLVVCATAQLHYPYEPHYQTSTPINKQPTTRVSLTRGTLVYPNNPRSAFGIRFPASPHQERPGLYPQAYPYHDTAPTGDTHQNNWNNPKPQVSGTGVYSQNRQNTYAPNKFNANLFRVIADPSQNVIYSPISLQLLLAFVSIGAGGETYNQLRNVLGLPVNKQDTPKAFQKVLQTQLYAGNAQLVMANKMYYSHERTLQQNAQELARNFDSAIEAIDFSSPFAAASAINGWVAQKTQNIIRELVMPAQLDAKTQAMLVNAIYFKAKWAKEFSTRDTEKQEFYVTPQRTVSVDMMYIDDSFNYGEFPELDATIVELKYENSNISMMILLPNKRDGLADMEQRLNDIDMKSLSARMRSETVIVRLPKFSIDFDIDMKGPLNQLGITDLFNDKADLKGLFYPSKSVVVSQMQHKAFLNVNEAGSEAAAASFIKLIPLSLPNRIIRFTADHPFMFAIRSPQAVFFIGHVVKI